jgi:uncharacterized SAM-dependent methyltransferase
MYLVSDAVQRVAIEQLQLQVELSAGESIHTENSYKYSLAEIDALASAAGMLRERSWVHPDWPYCLAVFVESP